MRNNNAFTLIELSIAIVIIGLIVAGVVTGQSLVKQAQLRSIVSDFNKFTSATNTFRLQYNGFPGDFKNGFSYFSGTNCTDGLIVGSGSNCNGNGNGQIEYWEAVKAWYHLSQAGLVEGQFSGLDDANMAPKGPISDSMYSMSNETGGTANPANAFAVGLLGPHTPDIQRNGMLTPQEAQSIDTKIDDGFAHSGSVWSEAGTNQEENGDICVSATPNSDYVLTVTGRNCVIQKTFLKTAKQTV